MVYIISIILSAPINKGWDNFAQLTNFTKLSQPLWVISQAPYLAKFHNLYRLVLKQLDIVVVSIFNVNNINVHTNTWLKFLNRRI